MCGIKWVKKVRGVFKINATSSLNFEISRCLSTALDRATHLDGGRCSLFDTTILRV